jgi:hypothetical protein
MNGVMLTAFESELRKIAEGNYNSPLATGQGSNIVTQPQFPKSGITSTSKNSVKSTNYSIVHNQAPAAANESAAPAPVKAVPPPPVRT